MGGAEWVAGAGKSSKAFYVTTPLSPSIMPEDISKAIETTADREKSIYSSCGRRMEPYDAGQGGSIRLLTANELSSHSRYYPSVQ